MIFECLFDINAAGNPFFKKIYDKIFDDLKIKYREHEFIHVQPKNEGNCMSCPGGLSNFQITNNINKKTILLSFWDRGMDFLNNNLGWENYNLIDYYGGIGISMDSKEIKSTYGVNHYPLQYPLGVVKSDEYIEKHRKSFNFDDREKRAVFIGRMHGNRKRICEILKEHPLIDIFDETSVYHHEKYFEKISNYLIGISLNGNGEFCLRDVEYLGMEIPIVRPKLKTTFHNKLEENKHFIPVDIISENADTRFLKYTDEEVAFKIIEKVEHILDKKELLSTVVKEGREYYDNYTNTDYISNLFISLININNII